MERFVAEYHGTVAGKWLAATILVSDNLAATEVVYKNLVDAVALEAAIGASLANLTLEPVGPSTYVSMFNKTTSSAYYEELIKRVDRTPKPRQQR